MTSRELGLSAAQRASVGRVLAQEAARREHVIVSVSGAHAYGFPSPDSDVDVKAVHLDSALKVLGFVHAAHGAERLEVVDGVEVDYSSNELGGVLQGVLKGNGNYLERFLSGFVLASSPLADELAGLVRASLSRRVARHYAGFATQQRHAWEEGGRRSAKKLLYVLRTLLTGTRLLQGRALETDVRVLFAEFGLEQAFELVREKQRGEHAELPEAMAGAWAERIDGVFAQLAQAEASSALPLAPSSEAEAALEACLVRARLATLR
jgi:predicted nucleotidyltransferase